MKLSIENSTADPRVRRFVPPTRIVWQSGGAAAPENPDILLRPGSGQPSMWNQRSCWLRYGDAPASILLDFGRELHGGIQIITGHTNDAQDVVRARVRFGESVSEAMGEPNQNHAIHDAIVDLPWAGWQEVGATGFRFVRIDLVDPGTQIELKEVRAVFLYRDLDYKGSFESNDERLNRIWQTGAYTVHLNMQDYVWDGIKRDRLVWIGDIHPEAMVINTVFGQVDVLPRSLDLTRDETTLPGPGFMNGMGSYSLWWIITHRDWYLYHGDLAYLKSQREYLLALLEHMAAFIGENNEETIPAGFLDWPTQYDRVAVHEGLQALMILGFRAGAELCEALGENAARAECEATVERLLAATPETSEKKTAWALMALAGMKDAREANEQILARDPLKNVSTFYGYYVLQARAKAGDYQGCLDVIRNYWGAMLDFGATTFWEDFNIEWLENAAPIDELVPEGKKDLHGDYGDFCYKGLRHSLCHGWAGGPTAWLSEHVLGFRPLEPGSKRLLVDPNLGDLEWAKGTFPTPRGIVAVSHKRLADGTVETEIDAPEGVEIVRG